MIYQICLLGFFFLTHTMANLSQYCSDTEQMGFGVLCSPRDQFKRIYQDCAIVYFPDVQ